MAEIAEALLGDGDGAGDHLVLTDVSMPGGKNGVVLAREAQRQHPHLKVLLMTGLADGSPERFNGEGCEVAFKPFSADDLHKKVRRTLDSVAAAWRAEPAGGASARRANSGAYHPDVGRSAPQRRLQTRAMRLGQAHCVAPLWAALVLGLAALPALAGRCVDEGGFDGAPAAAADAAPGSNPRGMLAEMVRDALARSQALGAAQLLAEAALSDVDEVRAGKAVQASVGSSIGPTAANTPGYTETSATQARASLNVSQLLFDGGRVDRLTDWRTQLAESARYGYLSQQEQIAVNTVALALERSRYRMQIQVWRQYARKMGCLVEALDTIVRADRGRASELVQAKKSQQQAEIAVTQAQSQARQVDVRLRRLVGDGLQGVQGLSSVLLAVPDMASVQDDAEHAAEIAQIGAQASAAERYARAVEAGRKPQVSWTFGGSANTAIGGNTPKTSASRGSSLGLGIAINVPLLSPAIDASSDAARKRAQALLLQRADAVEARRFRVAEVHEQTLSAFDHARRISAVLRDSDLVRNYTLQQWQQLGRRSLFDVMAAESEHYSLRVAYVNAIHDGQQLNAILLSLGPGLNEWLR